MKTIILFLSTLMISFTSLAESQATVQASKSFETSISESKPGPGKKHAKQLRKMRARAAKSSKRSGGDLTNFNCGRR